jgi:FixJ family two-component response regulator
MAPVVKGSKTKKTHLPRILVVDDEPQLLEVIRDVAGNEIDCRISTATSIEEAKKSLIVQSVDLLIVDIHLPDGDGMSLIDLHQKHNPAAGTIIMTGQPSVDRAISAIQRGALDFLPKPFNSDVLVDRVRKALGRRSLIDKQAQRIERLRDAVRRLNKARRTVSKKVDLLCNDLIGAYGDLSKQFDLVRVQESFRNCLQESADLEQMLCHAMDWLLRQVGYSNVAIWLATDGGEMQLGAYMKYTIAGDPHIVDAILRTVVPPTIENGLLRISSDELDEEFTESEQEDLAGQQFVGLNCTYLGETLATIVFFRDETAPFTDEDAATLQAVSSIFAVSLATIVHEHGGSESADEEDDRGNADWWKRGESSPY